MVSVDAKGLVLIPNSRLLWVFWVGSGYRSGFRGWFWGNSGLLACWAAPPWKHRKSEDLLEQKRVRCEAVSQSLPEASLRDRKSVV